MKANHVWVVERLDYGTDWHPIYADHRKDEAEEELRIASGDKSHEYRLRKYVSQE